MKAYPPLPTVSPREVLQLGAVQVATARTGGRLKGSAPVQMALLVDETDTGLPKLVHAETGECCGVCVSAAQAERVRNFFR